MASPEAGKPAAEVSLELQASPGMSHPDGLRRAHTTFAKTGMAITVKVRAVRDSSARHVARFALNTCVADGLRAWLPMPPLRCTPSLAAATPSPAGPVAVRKEQCGEGQGGCAAQGRDWLL